MYYLIVTNYLFREDIIHLSSPFLYMMFVYLIQFINPIPDNKIMIFFRKWHNINLSVLSLLMFTIGQVGQCQTGKFESVDAFLCKPYGDNQFAYYSAMAFLYSKYFFKRFVSRYFFGVFRVQSLTLLYLSMRSLNFVNIS